ncbi:MAG TPA: hypothetical protein VFS67_05195 [Polyangiaceae bacterium]|nr:hypothetical protein [Polyangiaceae bacterium]
MASTSAVAAPTKAGGRISEAARSHFEDGVRYLQSTSPDRFERAYQEFKAAYADSSSWQVLGNLGMVAQELERYGEAIDAYRGYLEGGSKKLKAKERKQFQRDLSLLESDVATLKLEASPEGVWVVDERVPEMGTPVVNRYGPVSGELELRVRPGHHLVHAELSGYTAVTWEVNAAAGSTAVHRFELQEIRPASEARAHGSVPQPSAPLAAKDEPPPDVPGINGLRVASYAALGLGAVGLGVGTWFLVQQHGTADDADRAFKNCETRRGTPGICDVNQLNSMAQRDEYALKAQRLDGKEADQRTSATIGFIAGGALFAGGLVLFLTSASSDDEGDASAQIVPWLNARGVAVSGRF